MAKHIVYVRSRWRRIKMPVKTSWHDVNRSAWEKPEQPAALHSVSDFVYFKHLVLCCCWLFFFLAAASRWAPSWPWVGSAPRKPWTGTSSGTSSWRGSSRCPWPACSAPPSWPCSSTASCPTSEGDPARDGEQRRERERWKHSSSVTKEEMKRGKGQEEEATDGLGCTVDVRRVGSYAAWLRSPEICFLFCFYSSFEFPIDFYLFSSFGCIRKCVTNVFHSICCTYDNNRENSSNKNYGCWKKQWRPLSVSSLKKRNHEFEKYKKKTAHDWKIIG